MSNSAIAGGVFVIAIGLIAVINFNNLEIIFDSNRADRGAIFYHDDIILSVADCGVQSQPRTQCFFTITRDVKVTNTGNTASDFGNILFGGNLRRCDREHAAQEFIDLFHTDNSTQNITSNPYQIVFCKNDRPLILNSGSSRTITITTVVTAITNQ
jgi:hypothetical protein